MFEVRKKILAKAVWIKPSFLDAPHESFEGTSPIGPNQPEGEGGAPNVEYGLGCVRTPRDTRTGERTNHRTAPHVRRTGNIRHRTKPYFTARHRKHRTSTLLCRTAVIPHAKHCRTKRAQIALKHFTGLLCTVSPKGIGPMLLCPPVLSPLSTFRSRNLNAKKKQVHGPSPYAKRTSRDART